MTERLTNLRAIEVSYVVRGANGKRFLILKEGDVPKTKTNVEKIQALLETTTLKNEDKINGILKNMEGGDAEVLKSALRVIQGMGDKVNPALAQELMACIDLAGQGAPAQQQQQQNQAPSPEQVQNSPTYKELATDRDAQKARADKAEGELVEVKKAAEEKAGEDELFPIKKSADGKEELDLEKVPEPLRKQVSKLWDVRVADKAKADKVQKELDKERDDRITKEFDDKAKAFDKLPVKKEDLSKCLKEVSLKAPEAYAIVETALKAANELAAKANPTAEHGSGQSNGGSSSSSDADYEVIEKSAEAHFKDDKKMTRAQKVTKFITNVDEGRKAYAAYVQKKQSA